MNARQPLYSKEEYARRGTKLYEQIIRPQVEAYNKGKIVAVIIENGEYAVGEDILSAAQSLLDKNADAQVWSVRIGYDTLSRIASHSMK